MTSPSFTVEDLSFIRDQSVNAAFMDFNRAVDCCPEALFVFYEGLDNDYYYPRLLQHAGREVEPIMCKNKSRVISVYKLLVAKPEYAKYHKGFFIDKDFDISSDSIYGDFFVTNCYSIENYYLSDSCMENILKQMFNFHSGTPDLKDVLDDYRSLRQKYFEAILLFNTWYCAIRRKYGNTIEGIQLKKELPDGFIKIDYDAKDVQMLYTLSEIESKFTSYSRYPVTPNEMSDAEAYIRTDIQKNLRGKYGLCFLEKYLSYLVDFFRKTPSYSTHKRVISIQYNNMMAILSPFADTEKDLVDYINRISA